MKKLFFGIFALLISAASMVACVRDEVLDIPNSIKSETITFGATLKFPEDVDTRSSSSLGNRVGNHFIVSADKADSLPMGIYVQDGIRSAYEGTTRGSVVSKASDIAAFNVWANYTPSENEDAISYFSNVAYENYENRNGIFYPKNTSDEYYWPGAGTLDFVAVANAPESGFTANVESNVVKSFTYTVPADPTKQPDVMLAKATAAGSSNASVPLDFDHIMSAVNVKIGSVVEGEIRSITFKNVYTTGEYLVDQGVWVVDKTKKGDFTVKMEGGKFVSSGQDASGTPVNTSDATFMFIPQNPGDDAEMVIEFYDNTTNTLYTGSTALRGSIAGDNWDKRKTTNYMLSIDESFTMTIEPVGKKLDAHYIIAYADVTVDFKENTTRNWTITASATPSADVVTILPEDEVNPLAKQGFWTDKVVDANGNITAESARGSSSWSGSGNVLNKRFYIFIPENINDKDREIKLILHSTGSSTAETTKVLLQKYPNWTAGSFGWEVVDDAEAGKYGFKWTRKVAYMYPYTEFHLSSTPKNYDVYNYCVSYIQQYGANANGFASAGLSDNYNWPTDNWTGINYGRRAYIYLNYEVLNNLNGVDSSSDGYANTLLLYEKAGSTSTSQFETVLTTTKKTESGKEGDNMFRLPGSNEVSAGVPAVTGNNNDLSGVLEYIQKKNRYYVLKKYQTDSAGASIVSYVPYFFESDLKWYLPAYGQFQYFTPDPNIPGDDKANYWSSTAVDGASEAYIGDGTPKDRDLEYRVIAVRRDENGYGNATAQVDNSSMAGGENGSTNNWLQ